MPARLPRLVLLGALLVGAALLAGCRAETPASAPDADAADTLAVPAVGWPIRAMTLDARRRPPDATLDRLAALGATHVALIPFGFQRGPHVPEVRMHTGDPGGDGWYSETDAGIRDLCARAKARGMGCLLKPHIWIGRYSADGQARDRVGFATEAQWQRWQAQYRRFLMHYARLAEETGADVLSIGTELLGVVRARPAFWRALAAEVRTVYGGRLTYAANWYAEAEAVTFWDALDVVGVQAYFPLADADTASLDALVAGWGRHVEALRRLHAASGKPVLFTEVGYRSVGYAAREPWRWPARAERGTVPPDPATQARLYRALFRRFDGVPWMAGVVVWKWHPPDEGARPLGFTPQGKPAARVIAKGFGGDTGLEDRVRCRHRRSTVHGLRSRVGPSS